MAKHQDESSEVVSFRISRLVLDQLDRLANFERRTRAGMIRVMLENSVSAVRIVSQHLEWLVKELNEKDMGATDSPQAEYLRGELHATKWLLDLFCGRRVKEHTLDQVRKKTGLPIPHIVPLDENGQRFGFDSDAG
ncbi:MAG: hypothetical protein LAO21_01475 [Acidobacteriia bacterium]|nr:hypothetical protein [Terriglobia bacterium]